MADGIRSTGEFEPAAVGADEIVCFDLASVGGEIFADVGEAKSLDRAADQGWNIRMFFSLALPLELALHVVGAAAFSFGGRNEEVVACDGEGAGIPLGWNIRMFFSLALPLELALHVVGAAAFSFGGRNEEVVACDGEGAGIPLGG